MTQYYSGLIVGFLIGNVFCLVFGGGWVLHKYTKLRKKYNRLRY